MNRKRSIVKWLILVVLAFGTLGMSYAAHTNILTSNFNLSTSNMSFVFDRNKHEDVAVEIQQGYDGAVKDLGGIISYDDKKLEIKNIGPININDFCDGDAIITIKYVIKSEDEEHGIKQTATIESKKDQGYDLGSVEFELMSHTPIWSIETDDQSWGTKDIGRTPDVIYEYLPESLGEFHAYNTMIPSEDEDGVMIGTIILKQERGLSIPETLEIGLSSLNLPSEISSEIENGSSIEIEGNYGFAIPLDLDQFNVER